MSVAPPPAANEQQRETSRRSYVHIGCLLLRLALAAAFLYAGARKAGGPQRFALDIESYRLLPPGMVLLAACYLPYLEIAGGLALLTRRTAPGGLLLIGGLMTLFLLALLSAWLRGLEIRCGCFGGDEAPSADYWRWLLRDLALLAACGLLWRHHRFSKTTPSNQTLP